MRLTRDRPGDSEVEAKEEKINQSKSAVRTEYLMLMTMAAAESSVLAVYLGVDQLLQSRYPSISTLIDEQSG